MTQRPKEKRGGEEKRMKINSNIKRYCKQIIQKVIASMQPTWKATCRVLKHGVGRGPYVVMASFI